LLTIIFSILFDRWLKQRWLKQSLWYLDTIEQVRPKLGKLGWALVIISHYSSRILLSIFSSTIVYNILPLVSFPTCLRDAF
jgi:hypothetical protein